MFDFFIVNGELSYKLLFIC